jgi:hypothetical protein
MADPILPLPEVRRRVTDLVDMGTPIDQAMHIVAVDLHMSFERVQEICEQEIEA